MNNSSYYGRGWSAPWQTGPRAGRRRARMTGMTEAPERAGDAPTGRNAQLDVLVTGYVGDRVGSTVLLVREGDLVLVVDPGMVAARSLILEPLAALGVQPDQVTDVVISHHHPDHTMNLALFQAARVHDVMAIYTDDLWQDRPAEGFELSPSVRLIETPGHSPQDITTLIGTAEGVAAATHAWWSAQGPAEDPFAPDAAVLSTSRQRILAVADLIVPGHGVAFRPSSDTPG